MSTYDRPYTNGDLAQALMEIHAAIVAEKYFQDVNQHMHMFDTGGAALTLAQYRDELEQSYLLMVRQNENADQSALDEWNNRL